MPTRIEKYKELREEIKKATFCGVPMEEAIKVIEEYKYFKQRGETSLQTIFNNILEDANKLFKESEELLKKAKDGVSK